MTFEAEWCWTQFRLLKVGGIWGVPRSGLVFRKESEQPPALLLIDVMPHEQGMPLSAEALAAYQRDDYEAIRREFVAAGIAVAGREVITTTRYAR